MANPDNRGLKRIINATRFSWQGLKATYKHEAAFRQELMLALFLFPAGLVLGDGGLEKALLVFVLLLVLMVELLNSGLEAAIDRFGGDHHELSGRAKDAGSAAVFIALVNVPLTWCLVLFF